MAEPTRKPDRAADIAFRDKFLMNPDTGWGEFLSVYEGMIRQLIRRFRMSPEDSEEAYQEVMEQFVKAEFNALRSWRPEECSLARWVTVVTTNSLISYTRSAFFKYASRRAHGESEESGEDLVDSFASPVESARERLHRSIVAQVFERAILDLVNQGRLNTDDLQLIRLRISGMNFDEIERVTGIPRSSASSRMTRLKPILLQSLTRAGIRKSDLV